MSSSRANDVIRQLAALPRRSKIAAQIAADSAIIQFCLVFTLAVRTGSIGFMLEGRFWLLTSYVTIVYVVALAAAGTYRKIIRFASLDLILPITTAAFIAGCALLALGWLFNAWSPRSLPLTFGLLSLVLIGGWRLVMRNIIYSLDTPHRQRVIIYGAGEAGRQILQTMRQTREYEPVAFVDDAGVLRDMSILGCKVFPADRLGQLIEQQGATHVLLALPSATQDQRKAIIRQLEAYPVHVLTVPRLADLLAGTAGVTEVQEVSIEDILGRDPVVPKPELMSGNIADKVVMVTGAGGSIGSELCRQIVQLDPEKLVLFEISEIGLYRIEAELRTIVGKLRRSIEIVPILGSVRDQNLLERVMRTFAVQTVYHAAAYKHVPIVEENVVEGIRNNVFGTAALAQAAIDTGVELFVLISTDKAVRPTNVMGATKRIAELICQNAEAVSSRTRFSMVRFGNVLGSSGSVVPRFQEQIRCGGPVTVTHPEVTRYFMTIPEAAQLVIQAGAMGTGGDVFLLDMGEPVRIIDLAARIIRLAGFQPYLQEWDEVIAGIPETPGDIAIMISGLRNGEKLYEELLIDDNAMQTDHPRIMKANEHQLDGPALSALLDALEAACSVNDVSAIRDLLGGSRIAYSPSHGIADLAWLRLDKPARTSPGLMFVTPPAETASQLIRQ